MSTEVNRLRWRCRRGHLELDLCLQRFLDRGYADLTPELRHRFAQLLQLGDDTLLAWLVEGKPVISTEYIDVVATIRAI